MKKMFTVLFAGMLLLSFAGVASAEHKVWQGEQPNYTFSVGGQIEIDGWLQDNFNGAVLTEDQIRYYNQETRLAFKGNWGDVVGMIRLEYDYDWSQGNQNKGNTTQNPLDLAWLSFPIPGTPVSVLAGLKDIKFGKVGLWLDDSYYALQATTKFGDNSLALGTLKLFEDKVPDGEDWDAYYALFSTKAIPSVNLSAIFLAETNENPLTVVRGWAGNEDYNPWTLGIYADGAAAGLKYWVEGYYQGGTLTKDLDLSAFAVAAGLGLTAGPADLGLIGIYSSGDSDNLDGDSEAFIVMPNPNVGDNFDLIIVDDLLANVVSNVWVVAANAAVKPVANLTLKGQVGFYNFVEDVNDETYIGTEIDLQALYRINEYLLWRVTGGYVVAGDALGENADDLFELNNEFLVTF